MGRVLLSVDCQLSSSLTQEELSQSSYIEDLLFSLTPDSMSRVAIAPRIPLKVSDDGQSTPWNSAPFLRSHSKNSCSSIGRRVYAV